MKIANSTIDLKFYFIKNGENIENNRSTIFKLKNKNWRTTRSSLMPDNVTFVNYAFEKVLTSMTL